MKNCEVCAFCALTEKIGVPVKPNRWYDFAFYLAFALLFARPLCGEYMDKIARILFVLHNHNIATRKTFFVPDIRDRLCYIFYTFSRNRKQNIAVFKIFWVRYIFQIRVRFTSVKPSIICGIDFTITHTRNTAFCHLFTLNTRSTVNIGCDVF